MITIETTSHLTGDETGETGIVDHVVDAISVNGNLAGWIYMFTDSATVINADTMDEIEITSYSEGFERLTGVSDLAGLN